MPDFVFNEEALRELVNDVDGGVAGELRRHADRIVEATKQHLSTPLPPRVAGQRQLNETGIPFLRSGDLRQSVHRVEQPFIEDDGLIAYGITADAVHHGAQYALILLERDFRLAPDSIFNPE